MAPFYLKDSGMIATLIYILFGIGFSYLVTTVLKPDVTIRLKTKAVIAACWLPIFVLLIGAFIAIIVDELFFDGKI